MQLLYATLLVTGVLAAAAAIAINFYVVLSAWKHANPRDHHNPDWMVVGLRLYGRYILAYFLLLATSLAAFLFAVAVQKHLT